MNLETYTYISISVMALGNEKRPKERKDVTVLPAGIIVRNEEGSEGGKELGKQVATMIISMCSINRSDTHVSEASYRDTNLRKLLANTGLIVINSSILSITETRLAEIKM